MVLSSNKAECGSWFFRDISMAAAALAPTGKLLAGINLSNPLLVTGRDKQGLPTGIAPDVAALVAQILGVPLQIKPYASPGETADAVHECGIVLIAEEAQRAERIAFSPPYVAIEATYMVREGWDDADIASIDQDGVTIVAAARSAYDLWLTRHIIRAQIKRIPGLKEAEAYFENGGGDVLAGLRPALLALQPRLKGSRLMEKPFSLVNQAIGTAHARSHGVAFLKALINCATANGLIAEIIKRHQVVGLKIV